MACSYCYVPAIYKKLSTLQGVLGKNGLAHENAVVLRAGAIEVLARQLLHPSGKAKHADPADRRVLFASPSDDVAANMELVRSTVEACKLLLTHTHWQIRLLSKSPLLEKIAHLLCAWAGSGAGGTVTELAVRERLILGFSTGTLDDGIARAIEEGAPLVSKRIAALHRLQDAGFRTYGMVCPSLPQDDYVKFAAEMAKALRWERLEHIWAEVINVRGASFDRTYNRLAGAGYHKEATAIKDVSHDAVLWESYNRETFLAHLAVYAAAPGKLRYLTYVKESNRTWWGANGGLEAVLL
jgi:DNA repair photolyase